MEENQSKSQESENQEINAAELAEITESLTEEKKEVKFRHPQQILTNKEIQILLEKQGYADNLKAEMLKMGEDPNSVEELTETEKGAITLFMLRMKHHNSKPKQLTNKVRKARKRARSISKKSRKINR